MTTERKFDLEDRLVDFAVLIIRITESLMNTKAGNYIGGQLVRSGNFSCITLWRSTKC